MRSREQKLDEDSKQSWDEYTGPAGTSQPEIAAARIGGAVRLIREKWNGILERRVEERIHMDRNQLRKLDQREQHVLNLLEDNVIEGEHLEEKISSSTLLVDKMVDGLIPTNSRATSTVQQNDHGETGSSFQSETVLSSDHAASDSQLDSLNR